MNCDDDYYSYTDDVMTNIMTVCCLVSGSRTSGVGGAELAARGAGFLCVPASSFLSCLPYHPTQTMASSFRTAGRKIVAIGRNFAEHAKELNNAVPTEPFFFLKPTSSYLDNGGTIEIPKGVVAHFEGASSS